MNCESKKLERRILRIGHFFPMDRSVFFPAGFESELPNLQDISTHCILYKKNLSHRHEGWSFDCEGRLVWLTCEDGRSKPSAVVRDHHQWQTQSFEAISLGHRIYSKAHSKTGEGTQRRQHCGGNERQYFIHWTLEKVMDPSSDVLGPKRIEMYQNPVPKKHSSNQKDTNKRYKDSLKCF